jgi:methylglutaconyl-CoA hydratase
MPHELIATRRDGPVEYLTLNRPEVRNAFNEHLGRELTDWAEATSNDGQVRVVVLAGAGKSFCAGADLAWMSRMASYTHEENLRDASEMARMFSTLDRLPVPMIGRVHGAALGGGAGLAAVCDVVVADEHAGFGFTEVKVGILPSVIAPYALTKIGVSATRELFLTGMRFDAVRAREIGLVHAVVPADRLDARVNEYVQELLSAAPGAIATAKELIRKLWGRPAADTIGLTAETIALHRATPDAQEGMRAFLEKRKAAWNVSGQ